MLNFTQSIPRWKTIRHQLGRIWWSKLTPPHQAIRCEIFSVLYKPALSTFQSCCWRQTPKVKFPAIPTDQHLIRTGIELLQRFYTPRGIRQFRCLSHMPEQDCKEAYDAALPHYCEERLERPDCFHTCQTAIASSYQADPKRRTKDVLQNSKTVTLDEAPHVLAPSQMSQRWTLTAV